ncbi:MAG: type II secretion system F family protein [Chloroflexota bacterium]
MLVILIVLSLFGFVALTSVAVLGKRQESAMESRIQSFRNRNMYKDDLSIDLDVSFLDRVFRPGLAGIGSSFSRILPQSTLRQVQVQLVQAGNPMSYQSFLTFYAITFGMCLFFGMFFLISFPGAFFPNRVVIGGGIIMIGYVLPRSWLKGKVKYKQKLILKALPDALDLITTCVEAGLGLDAALQRVADKSEGPLAEELTKMLRDISMGKLRREAMQELGDRVGVEQLQTFITAIIQAEQLGVGIAQVLRVQSDMLRTARRQRAERQAHEAPIKMIFPLVLFIFPAFLAVILGPAVIRIAGAF